MREEAEREKKELQREKDEAAARQRAKRKQRAKELEGADRHLEMHIRRAQTLPANERSWALWRTPIESGPQTEQPSASDEHQRSHRIPVRYSAKLNYAFSLRYLKI